MKGIIFNLFEQVVVRDHGEAAWDDLLDATGLDGAYTSLGSYPDEEIAKLLEAGSGALGLSTGDLLRWFGREAMPLLAGHYPAFFTEHRSTRSFILSVNSIIHPEVRKLYAGAHCPFFHFKEAEDGALLMAYDSPRKLCALAHGFIEGAGDHFHQPMTVDHVSCMHRGDPKCLLSIRETVAEQVYADARA
ncbi:MAG: hypothetical protein RJB62_451 [Pseudomonadota bacterium]|jgi:hypothetical protein